MASPAGRAGGQIEGSPVISRAYPAAIRGQQMVNEELIIFGIKRFAAAGLRKFSALRRFDGSVFEEQPVENGGRDGCFLEVIGQLETGLVKPPEFEESISGVIGGGSLD